jgi:hypothetical protein
LSNHRHQTSNVRKTTLACAVTILLAGGVWLLMGEPVEHWPGGASLPERGSAVAAAGDALIGAEASRAARPSCGTAASPFASADGCKHAGSSGADAAEQATLRPMAPVRSEDVERALRQAETGTALALLPYVDLRSQCLEQGHQRGPVCFSSEELAALDARFLQTAGRLAQAGNPDAQLALVTWWRLRAYQLLEADPVASHVEWDEPEEKLVARVMGSSQFMEALRQSRDMYERLAANDPSKLEKTAYLEEYKRYGIVTGPSPAR